MSLGKIRPACTPTPVGRIARERRKMQPLTHHQKIMLGTHCAVRLTPYQAAEQRGDLVKLARLGRTGEKKECPGYGRVYTWRNGQSAIYIDEPKPFMIIVDEDRVVCSTVNEVLVPGEWLDRLLSVANATDC